MAIGIFFEYKKQVVQLPVNPPELPVESGGDNERANVVGLGEVTLIRKRLLNYYEFSSFFPKAGGAPYIAVDEPQAPDFYINFIQGIRDDEKPCGFTVSDIGINEIVTIENFEFTYAAGGDDILYTIGLKAWKPYEAVEITLPEPQQEAAVVEDAPVAAAAPVEVAAPPQEQPRPNVAGELSIGMAVIANGQLRYDSYGAKPGKTMQDFKGKISHMVTAPKPGQDWPVHITDMSGGWMGWLARGEVAPA